MSQILLSLLPAESKLSNVLLVSTISHNPVNAFELWLNPHRDLEGCFKCPLLLLLLQDWGADKQ